MADAFPVRWHPQLTCALLLLAPALAGEEAFIAGADLSHLKFFEDRGVVYRDEQGARDALEILRDRGINHVRLRLFTSRPEQADADPYNAINNLDYAVPLAVRVQQAGLRFLLDLHYSDSWADPGQQTKPSEWANLNFAQLEERVYDYTREAIAAFATAGAEPDIVQIGNEIIGGLLWPEGRVGGSYDTAVQWSQLGRLLKSAIRGVEDGAGATQPRILLHLDRGGDWGATRWFFDRLLQEQVRFDLIGQSYYPWWHGSLNDLRTCLNQAAVRYGKPLLVVETAFPWDGPTDIAGITPTPTGQVEDPIELAMILRQVPGGKGGGVFWWGAEYIDLPEYSLAGFDRRSFFDGEGQTLPVARALGQMTAPIRLEAELTPGALRLTWPISGAGMGLYSTPHLSTPWTRIATNPAWDGSGLANTLPRTNDSRLYRLQK